MLMIFGRQHKKDEKHVKNIAASIMVMKKIPVSWKDPFPQ
jgi:hypothetical protein